ncbi:Os07g0188750 [Oryza sativa Japonica Group]|uniref:Os07g0188750 protein n=1 Tax=Oryza sativa subsp. japonica TaxID=39947 RepID=A0A0P0X3L6_ORYSJ|nr:hypothetical protein EE612_037580 [Oryza sativa]BAT00396.1 Os07g0188750 [Oryza sativa Japonica Group]
MASTTRGLATSYPLGHRQNLLRRIMSVYDMPWRRGRYSLTCMSASCPFPQCCNSRGRTGPWSPPAKKARMGRCDADGPPTWRSTTSLRRLISGRDTSLDGSNPSDVLALQSTLMELEKR